MILQFCCGLSSLDILFIKVKMNYSNEEKSHFCSCGRRCNDEGSVEALEKAQLK